MLQIMYKCIAINVDVYAIIFLAHNNRQNKSEINSKEHHFLKGRKYFLNKNLDVKTTPSKHWGLIEILQVNWNFNYILITF